MYQIKNRWAQAVLFECELPSDIAAESTAKQLGWAIRKARESGAYLRGAYLRDAYLRGAYLRGADLSGADLSGAYLRGAYLRDAYLRGAYLRGAYLRGADLRGADLRGADLSDAYLSGADLSGAIGYTGMTPAPETDDERKAREAARMARFRERFPDVPVLPQIDAQILARLEAKPDALDMAHWHGDADAGPACETTHCRAGWAVHLAGEKGYALEKKFDAAYAGRMIYLVSAGYVPEFYTDNETALEDIKKRAAEQVAALCFSL